MGGSRLQTTEVMDTETLEWSTAADLPQPVSRAPGAVCGDHVYILSLDSSSAGQDPQLVYGIKLLHHHSEIRLVCPFMVDC